MSLGFIFEMKSGKPDFHQQRFQFWNLEPEAVAGKVIFGT